MVAYGVHMVTPPTNQTIAARVRVAMDEAGQSEKSLADVTGIARSTLRRRLTGGSPFTTAELAAVAPVLEVRLVDLLADEESAA